MWIFTPDGFVSGVEDRKDPTVIVVRARDHGSLKAMLEHLALPVGRIKRGGGTDYPYRVRVSRDQFATFAGDMARGIWYSNYKDAVTKRRGKQYHDVLLSVWAATMRLTPKRVKAKLELERRARWQSVDTWFSDRNRDRDRRTVSSPTLLLEDSDDDDDEGARPRGLHTLTDAQWSALDAGDDDPPF